MSDVVLLDAGPLGLLSNPRHPPLVVACRQWAAALKAVGRRIIVPEISDYEVRRELLRAKKSLGIALLDRLAQQLDYLPLSTAVMRKAAELWSLARQQGKPTAPRDRLPVLCIEGFDEIVTSIVASIATGWNESCRVGIAPTEQGHLCTAHIEPRPIVRRLLCAVQRCRSSVGAIPTRQLLLQPVAIGAVVEETKLPKPSMERAAKAAPRAGRP